MNLVLLISKLYLLIFNIFILVLGNFGIVWILITLNEVSSWSPLVIVAVIGLAVFSSIFIIISLVGCWGVVTESRYSIIVTAINHTIIVIIQLLIAVCVYTLRDFLVELIKLFIKSKFQIPIVIEFDCIQKLLKCCGLTSREDYLIYNSRLPMSCYAGHDLKETYNGCNVNTADLLYQAIEPLMYSSLVLLICELISIVCSWLVLIYRKRPMDEVVNIEMRTKF